MKINSIKFFDYRAFYNGKDDQYLINVEGKNVLIYGENGSGKTSFFRGIKDFVTGADFVSHNQPVALNDGFIEIAFDDNSVERFDDNGGKSTKPEVLNAAKLNSFISYKELLKTYLVDTGDINLFDLLVNGILSDHELTSLGKLKEAWDLQRDKDLGERALEIEEAFIKKQITREEADEQLVIEREKIASDLVAFSDEVTLLLTEINNILSDILAYFNQDLEVELKLESIESKKYQEARISVNVKLFGLQITDYHDFLNEARLSAIALSIYFAAIKLNPTQNTLKVLFLDDVFIGLDMSNRMPLLDIINKEFVDWQTFITTYDRHWFEIAKPYLTRNWLNIEMYSIKENAHNIDVPFISKQSSDYFKKAEEYRDLGDYPASANYIRKELERLIKERLPEEKTRDYGEKPHTLQYLWQLLVGRYAALNNHVDEDIKNTLDTIKLSLLNPLSHDNLSIPVYRYELKKAFNLIDKITAIPIIKKVILLSAGMELQFKHPSQNYTFTMSLLTDWRMDILDSSQTLVSPKCQVKHFQFNDQDFWNFKTGTLMSSNEQEKLFVREDSLDKICDNHTKIAELSITKDLFEKHTTYSNLWTIKEIVTRSKDKVRPRLFARLWRELFN